jgi:transcriptional regulator with XRE-family HTH domain
MKSTASRSASAAKSAKSTKLGKTAAKPVKKATAAAEVQAGSWRRSEDEQTMNEELGRRLYAVRQAKGLSLARLSEDCGVPAATLSRIENNKMSPTFGVLARVMAGLGVDFGDLVNTRHLQPGEHLVSYADGGQGQETRIRDSRAVILHSHDHARLLPLMVDVRTRTLEECGGLTGHRGEEFCYVFSGTLVLHIEGEPPRIMRSGASALFDSSTPHAYLAGTASGAKILIVSLRS